MANPMKYIKDLEAAGFHRVQAEAQVQMVLDAIEGDLVTKNDLAVVNERIENRFIQFEGQIENRLSQLEERTERRFIESEFRLVARLGILMVSSITVGIAVLTWLIKI